MGLRLFSTEFFYKEGKGVSKDAPAKPPFVRFFEIYSIKFSHLSIAGLIYSGFALITALIYFIFCNNENISIIGEVSLRGIISVFTSLWPLILLALPAASMSFLARNIVREKPYFIWHDFIRMIKENWKKSLVLGVVNMILGTVAGYAAVTYLGRLDDGWMYYALFFLALLLTVVIIFATFYEFILLVSFDLSVGTILKYSVMISLGNLPGSIAAFLTEGAFAALFYFLIKLVFTNKAFANLSMLLLLIAVFFIIVVPLLFYTKAFVAWPTIEKLMKNNDDQTTDAEKDSETEDTESDFAAVTSEVTEADEEILEDTDDTDDDMVFFNGRMVRKDDIDYTNMK